MKEMIGKRDGFRGDSEKNSERWSWRDVRRQTVPKAASGHRKRTIADSGHSLFYFNMEPRLKWKKKSF